MVISAARAAGHCRASKRGPVLLGCVALVRKACVYPSKPCTVWVFKVVVCGYSWCQGGSVLLPLLLTKEALGGSLPALLGAPYVYI